MDNNTQDEEIAHPSDVGDNQNTFIINEKLKITHGYYDDQYYLKIWNNNEIIKEWTNKKDTIESQKINKELYEWLQDYADNKIELKKNIRNAISYLKQAKKKLKTTKTKNKYVQTEENNIFESNTPTPHKPSIGTHDHHWYFGVQVPTKQPVISKTGEIIGNKTVQLLIWIKDDHTWQPITTQTEQNNNITVIKEMTVDENRWSLPNIKSWVEGLEDTPNTTNIFERIKTQFKKYIYFDEEQYYNVLPVWIIGTYCHTLFNAYPYVNLWGMRNTGKTKVMMLSSILAFNSEVFINMSVAALFRIIELDNPSLFIDEAENLWQPQQKGNDDTSDLVACLNAGWMKGSKVARMEKLDDVFKIKKFDVYCPKMLASIKGLKGALDSRCVRIVMIRPSGVPASLLWMDSKDPELLRLRDELYVFTLKNWGLIKAYYDGDCELKNEYGLDNRNWQIWKPLLCIAKVFGDDLVKGLGDFAFDECENLKDEEISEDSWESKIGNALLGLVKGEEVIKYYLKDIKEAVDKEFIEKTYFDNYNNKDVVVFKKERPSNDFVGRFMSRIGLNKYKFIDNNRGYWLSKKRVAKSLFSMGINHFGGTSTISKVKDVLESGCKDFNTIKAECEKNEVNEEELNKCLTHLIAVGEVFMPKPDHYEVLK